jgi:outer membrane biosynthesis protein TonB
MSTRRLLALVAGTVILTAMCCFAAAGASEPMAAREALRRGLILVEVRPDYPHEARKRRLTGSGVFDMKFDYESGRVREVHVVQSTASRCLTQIPLPL